MNRTDAPKKQPVPFGVNGPREDLLPTTPAGDNTASYDAGFPPVTMILKSAGGLPPKGQDMNQILFELSSICRWFTAGALNAFDATFASSIGGYPKASVLVGDDGATIYISTIDANSNNPNSVTTGWLNLSKITAIAALPGGANKLPYFSGANTAAQTDFTDVGRSVVAQTSIANLLTYLGLGDGSTLPVGTPIPWPTSTAPSGWIKCNGATFTAAQYPKLALAYPGLVLPDLRGQFIRGWDDGKNIDTGRTLLSTQTDALQNITGSVNLAGTSLTQGIAFSASGAFTTGALTESTFSASNVNNNTRSNTLNFSAANVARTATETRPVNIAFNYIVRAA